MNNAVARTATLLSFTASKHSTSELGECVRNLEKTLNTYGVLFLFAAGGLPPLFSDIMFGGKVCFATADMNALHRRALGRLVSGGAARVIRYKRSGAYAVVTAGYKVQEHRNWIDVPTDQADHYEEVGLYAAIQAHEDAALETWARRVAE